MFLNTVEKDEHHLWPDNRKTDVTHLSAGRPCYQGNTANAMTAGFSWTWRISC